MQDKNQKSHIAQREEETLAFWKERNIFKKSLKKESPKGEFIFYEGPPTANGKPGIHHLEARAFKDAIPRFKTMQGYHVRRKGGWDTHGLPVELQVEKELGLKSKKEIESYGIEKFNQKCKESVWQYVDLWEKFTDRVAYWIDQDNPYVTYRTNYIESVWNIVKRIYDDGRIYKDYRVVPWCPRCGTALSSHELAQGYADVKDLSVTAEFRVKGKEDTSFLAWTTTPWTLPGNVALAVGPNITYVEIEKKDMGDGKLVRFILAKDRLKAVFGDDEYTIVKEMKGSELAGMEYEPLYDFLSGDKNLKDKENGWKAYEADFVTIEDGTGIVHTAVMYGQDDFELGNKVGLPKKHLVKEDGYFFDTTGELSGKFVKDEETDVTIIKDLAHRGLLFDKKKYEHSYPHCWRCKTPLIYYARDSWYIRMTDLRDKLVAENNDINWEPDHIRDGRFGEWLREVKDWSLSRERYWGTPLPVWLSKDGKEQKAIGSIDELKKETKRNTYFVMRHGQAESNAKNILSSKEDNLHHLTDKGKKEVDDAIKTLKSKKIDFIVASPFLRTKETAERVAKELGISKDQIMYDHRIKEVDAGTFNLKPVEEYRAFFSSVYEKFTKRPPEGETAIDVKKRAGEFIYDVDSQYEGKTILIITHEYVVWMLGAVKEGLTNEETAHIKDLTKDYVKTAEVKEFDFAYLPHNGNHEIDLHRPYIDEVILRDSKGDKMVRTKEVMDVWLDSGAMPYAQDHYPFENSDTFRPQKGWFKKQKGYPADFISEAIDQTRGWFYTLHALGVLLGNGKAYKNVVSLGHILDEKGKKMSKSLGNIVDPWEVSDKYGVDALRLWMYSVNQPGDAKNFDERTVDEIVKKVLNLLGNTKKFYELYRDESVKRDNTSKHVLDVWIVSRLSELNSAVTHGLENYQLFGPARAVREFIGDLSQWYVRRSRARFKSEEEKTDALKTLGYVLHELSKLMAPLAPFVAEDVYQVTKEEGDTESVHLADWPKIETKDEKILSAMKETREIVSSGLLNRAEAKIKVRQSLAKITIQKDLPDSYKGLIKEELNVKEVVVDSNQKSQTILDTNITDELKEEGHVREFIRNVQELRKKEGCSPDDTISLTVSTNDTVQKIVEANKKTIIDSTNTSDIAFGDVTGEELKDGDLGYKLSLKK
ncbi:isoleucine--tRNA ligase [bacterium]|nr:isoleucine--tRNA ligase [bacterium]|tara:strand:+ start:15960 stop:19433 length:3474 start_codon:yes stop_codon:yes gene_type:complete